MALTVGTGPFGRRAAGSFNFRYDAPAQVLYLEPSPREVRVEVAGETIARSRDVKLLHETGLMPVYYFPVDDVEGDLLEDSDHHTTCPFKGEASYHHIVVGDTRVENGAWYYPDGPDGEGDPLDLRGLIAFSFDRMDAWYEEDERIGVHPRDPYHRCDVVRSRRHVQVFVNGEKVADSTRPQMLFETGLPERYYLPAEDVREGVLIDSDTTSECPYKGTARYRSVRVDGETYDDLVWSYPEPHGEVGGIRGMLCFSNEKVDLVVDGEAQERVESRFG